MSVIAQRLRRARIRSGLKQTEVFDKVGINNKTLSGYENGVSEPDIETLNTLAQLYKVSVDYLTGRTENDQLPESETERIIKEIVREYNLDLTQPDIKKKLRDIVHLVWSDRQQK